MRVGEALLRVGVAVVVEKPLDVAGQYRPVADGPDKAEHVHGHARLVAVGVGDHHARAVGEDLEDRADGGVQLGIHEHDMLAVGDRLGGGAGAVLHLTGALDDRLDPRRAAQQQRIGRHRPPAAGQQSIQGFLVAHLDAVLHAGVGEHALRGLDGAVGDRHDPHPHHVALNHRGHALAHVAGPDHADPDGVALLLTALQRRVHDDHSAYLSDLVVPPIPDRDHSSHPASCPEITSTASGHLMANSGSS